MTKLTMTMLTMTMLTMTILTVQGDAPLPEVELRRWGYLAILPWVVAVVGLGLFDMMQAIVSMAILSKAIVSRVTVTIAALSRAAVHIAALT